MQLAPFPSGPAHGIGRNQPFPARRKPALRQLARRLLCCTLALPLGATAEELADLSLKQLMAVPVVGASKYEQTQDRVAAAVTVSTREETQLRLAHARRGARHPARRPHHLRPPVFQCGRALASASPATT